ncbi:recombinase family protein [Streptomyces olivoreticuli]
MQKLAAPAMPIEVRLAYARVSTRTQEIQSQVDALEASGVHRLFQEQISTRVRERPEMKAALATAREYRSLGAKVRDPRRTGDRPQERTWTITGR